MDQEIGEPSTSPPPQLDSVVPGGGEDGSQALELQHEDRPFEKSSSSKPPCLTVAFTTYFFLNLFIATSVCATINGLLAWVMYSPEAQEKFTHETSVWSLGVQNALAGDVLVTVLVMCVVTLCLSGGIVMADRRNNMTGKGPIRIVDRTCAYRRWLKRFFPESESFVRNYGPRLYAVLGPFEEIATGATSEFDCPCCRPAEGAGGEESTVKSKVALQQAGEANIEQLTAAGSDEQRKQYFEAVYSLPIRERIQQQLISALKVFGFLIPVFCIPLILILWLVVELASEHEWTQTSITYMKIFPFAILEFFLQGIVVLTGFQYSEFDVDDGNDRHRTITEDSLGRTVVKKLEEGI
ncbi:unnamed protein product [Amoebophrya sp. A25]|nr:unnamed protein product [Amoebophrya sp. A25]|eukprot:GSA25T00003929001.1